MQNTQAEEITNNLKHFSYR